MNYVWKNTMPVYKLCMQYYWSLPVYHSIHMWKQGTNREIKLSKSSFWEIAECHLAQTLMERWRAHVNYGTAVQNQFPTPKYSTNVFLGIHTTSNKTKSVIWTLMTVQVLWLFCIMGKSSVFYRNSCSNGFDIIHWLSCTVTVSEVSFGLGTGASSRHAAKMSALNPLLQCCDVMKIAYIPLLKASTATMYRLILSDTNL